MKIGVLALQGDFAEHIETLKKLKVEAVPVRLPQELDDLGGLIIPGGESTTFRRLGTEYGLLTAIKEFKQKGRAIFGTCAGMILLAKKATDLENGSLGLIDIEVKRNAFGSQIDSFETDLVMPVLGEQSFHAVFIRAPLIEKIDDRVEVLARLSSGTAVAARQGKILVSAFHPELTSDLRFHAFFLKMVADN